MELKEVKRELREVKLYYANIEAFKQFPEKVELVKKYCNAVCYASAELIAVFVYKYMQNNDLKTVAENMQLTERRIEVLSHRLNVFFKDNL